MKLNKIYLLAGIVAAGVFASCSDDDYEKGEVASGNQMQAVTFGEDNILEMELDPTAPTSQTITIYRDSAYMDAPASVPLKVVTNTDDVFVVPATAEFAAGSAEADITVTFDNAEIGVPYDLEIALDDAYVHPYKSSTTSRFSLEVQRVKWNNIGLAVFQDMFMDQGLAYYVELQQRDGTNDFRLIDPYYGSNADPNNWDGYLSGSTEKMFFSITNYTDKDADGDLFHYVTFYTFATGYLYDGAYMVYGFVPSELSESLAADDDLSVYYPDYGIVVLTPYYYIPGLGGFGESPIYIYLPDGSAPADAKAGDPVPMGGDDEEEEAPARGIRMTAPTADYQSAAVKSFKPVWARK